MVTPVIRTVDLRSDTVTKPTESMRSAMANAEVDDDVLGNDPTAVLLEREVAEIAGKEAAMFVPSGTMGNLISVLVHCDERGSEVILGDDSHIHIYENGGVSSLGGVHPRTVKNEEDGTMKISSIEAAVRSPKGDLHYPVTKLICLENTQANQVVSYSLNDVRRFCWLLRSCCGGRCLPIEYIDKVGELAKKHGLKLHIDGARIFNASVALGVPVRRIVQAADSVSICLSKGIGAPVGSVIVGSKSFITKARWLRKTLGGGMRQIGVLCAAALVALRENVAKLEDDHKNAKILAEGLNRIERLKVNVAAVETNIFYWQIYVDLPKDPKFIAEDACKSLEVLGVLVIPQTTFRIRIVLHHQISDSDLDYLLSCFEKLFSSVAEEKA
ncbi:hypothetical protein F2Q70_00024023 [Brassica cretica]|uniref:low-specificity L-threonine aldolase n=1 Tax=Brassica cretica TaxID=69181 RepID=A0A8S9GKJ4_BRACR|nr:hypothetical protein F2Q70_00024023 [Brassica cretica]